MAAQAKSLQIAIGRRWRARDFEAFVARLGCSQLAVARALGIHFTTLYRVVGRAALRNEPLPLVYQLACERLEALEREDA